MTDSIVVLRKAPRLCDECGSAISVGERAYVRYGRYPASYCLPCYEKKQAIWMGSRNLSDMKNHMIELLGEKPRSSKELVEIFGPDYIKIIHSLKKDGHKISGADGTDTAGRRTKVFSFYEEEWRKPEPLLTLEERHRNKTSKECPLSRINDDAVLEMILHEMRAAMARELVKQLFRLHGHLVLSATYDDDDPSDDDNSLSESGRTTLDFRIRLGSEPASQEYEVAVIFDPRYEQNLNVTFTEDHDSNLIVIVVSDEHIKCASLSEILSGVKIDAQSDNYLGDRTELQLNRDATFTLSDYICRFLRATGSSSI